MKNILFLQYFFYEVYMINSEEIQETYNSFFKNEITKKEAIDKLIIHVLKHPQFFGLETLTKENLQDIIFNLLKKIDSIFYTYDISKNTKFSTYFQMKVRYIHQTWKKNNFQENMKNIILNDFNVIECFDSERENQYSPDKILDSMTKENEAEYIHGNNSCKFPLELFNTKKNTKLEYLIIALKSSYVITEEQIKIVSQLANIDEEKLINFVNKLNEKLIKRKINKIRLQEMIQKDFYKLQEFKIKIGLNKHNNSYKDIFEKKLNHIKRRRSKNIERYKKIKLVPSDKDIGIVLNVSPARIRYFLRKNYRLHNIIPRKTGISLKEKIE